MGVTAILRNLRLTWPAELDRSTNLYSRVLREAGKQLMSINGIPQMEPLAPLVDQMAVLAREELPSPRSCKIRLWDDGTFNVFFYHSRGDEKQYVRYERTTSEILWEYGKGASSRSVELTGSETVIEPTIAETDVRILARVEPPYE